MIVQKNRYLEAATALLGSKKRAEAMLQTLESRTPESYQFVSHSTDPIEASLLLLHNAGATTTCLVTPPKSSSELEQMSDLILDGVQTLREGSTRLTQTVMAVDDRLLAQAYEAAGFTELAILSYMERMTNDTVHVPAKANVTFNSMVMATEEQIQHILLETYVDSLDCPGIHGLRLIQDIVDGHKSQGEYDPQLWTIAELEGVPVGVLLLNPISETESMELTYLGCTPNVRGRGVGDALVHLAIEQTATYGLPKIILAVDSDNTPALGLYSRWNFHTTHQRRTMIQKLY
jgi:N-acetylglutamate synthase-like GNAT family acetyltransferase